MLWYIGVYPFNLNQIIVRIHAILTYALRRILSIDGVQNLVKVYVD